MAKYRNDFYVEQSVGDAVEALKKAISSLDEAALRAGRIDGLLGVLPLVTAKVSLMDILKELEAGL